MHGRRTSFSSRSLLMIAEDMGRLGLWSYNEMSQDISWSPGMHKLLGTDPSLDEPSFDALMRNVHPEDQEKLHKAYELSKQGVFPELKFRVIHPNGQLRWLSCRAEVLYAKDGSYLQSSGLIVDVTDQQTLLELFRRKEKRLDALAEGFNFSMWSADRTGALTAFPQWRLFGVSSPAKLLGWAWLERVPENEREQAQATWQQAVADGKHFVSRVKFMLRPSEKPMTLMIYAAPVRNSEGAIVEWAGLIARPADVMHAPPDVHQVKAPHIRAARALLNWSIEDLANKSKASVSSIRRVESCDTSSIRRPTLEAIKAALEEGGVIFGNRDGTVSVALRS
ncbi:PAS domain-containing protein [Nitrobacteraceae bacterium AZCC 1564]